MCIYKINVYKKYNQKRIILLAQKAINEFGNPTHHYHEWNLSNETPVCRVHSVHMYVRTCY